MNKTLVAVVGIIAFVGIVAYYLQQPQTVSLSRMLGPGLLNAQMDQYQYYRELGIPDGAKFLMYQDVQGHSYGCVWLIDSSRHYLTDLTPFGVPANFVTKWDVTGYWVGNVSIINDAGSQNLFVLVKMVVSN